MLFGLLRKRYKMENFEYNKRFGLVVRTGSAGCQHDRCDRIIQNGRAQGGDQAAGEKESPGRCVLSNVWAEGQLYSSYCTGLMRAQAGKALQVRGRAGRCNSLGSRRIKLVDACVPEASSQAT
jgi:hypothetical protein